MTPPRDVPARLWTVATVSRRLGVARGTVHRLLRERRMSGIRIGRRWRVEPSAVDAFVQRHRSIAQDELPPVKDDRQLALFDGAAEGVAVDELAAATADGEATPTSAQDWPADRLTMDAEAGTVSYQLTAEQLERLLLPITGDGGWQSLMRTVRAGLTYVQNGRAVVVMDEDTRARVVEYRRNYGDAGGWQARLSFIPG